MWKAPNVLVDKEPLKTLTSVSVAGEKASFLGELVVVRMGVEVPRLVMWSGEPAGVDQVCFLK